MVGTSGPNTSLPVAHHDYHGPAVTSKLVGEKKKSVGVMRWLICGCAAGTTTDLTDKAMQGIVESSKDISRSVRTVQILQILSLSMVILCWNK